MSYDVASVNPATTCVERPAVSHLVAEVGERVELKETVVSCGVWREFLVEDVERVVIGNIPTRSSFTPAQCIQLLKSTC